MKFRWIPALIIVSMLFGVMIGIRINDLTELIPNVEKKAETSEYTILKRQELNKAENINLKSKEQNKVENVESVEVFSSSSEPVLQEVRTESGFLTKVGRNLDKGVSIIFSKLISRII